MSTCHSCLQGDWYALYTRCRHEFKVHTQLSSKRIHTYLPFFEEVRQWWDRKKKVKCPLFPGYIFVNCNMDKNNYYDILNTLGVVKVVGNGWPKLSRIPSEQIESIKIALESQLPINILPGLQNGDLVQVKSGILKGVRGILVKKNSKNCNIVIAIESLNQSIHVQVDCNKFQVEKISAT